jgi:hypothetical protein
MIILAMKEGRLNPDRAQALVRSITDPARQARARQSLEEIEVIREVRAVAHADLDQAEALAQRISTPDWQALVLLNLARQATPARARRIIAQAFRLSFWAMPLDALAQVEPAALTAIADELLRFA